MKWKLSVGVSSSACRSLNSPYITALVAVSDPSGAKTTKSFEMTIGEFKVRCCEVKVRFLELFTSLFFFFFLSFEVLLIVKKYLVVCSE